MTGVPYTDIAVDVGGVFVVVIGVGWFPWFCVPTVIVIGKRLVSVVDVCGIVLGVPGVFVVVGVIGICFPRVSSFVVVGENVMDVVGVCGLP